MQMQGLGLKPNSYQSLPPAHLQNQILLQAQGMTQPAVWFCKPEAWVSSLTLPSPQDPIILSIIPLVLFQIHLHFFISTAAFLFQVTIIFHPTSLLMHPLASFNSFSTLDFSKNANLSVALINLKVAIKICPPQQTWCRPGLAAPQPIAKHLLFCPRPMSQPLRLPFRSRRASSPSPV